MFTTEMSKTRRPLVFARSGSGWLPWRTQAAAACLAACGVSLVPFGCQQGPAVVYVEGVIRLNGEPLEGANVGFTPLDSPGGIPAAGFTDATGRFVLSARGARFGAGTTVGDYVVIVSKTVIPPGEEDKDSPQVKLVTPEIYRAKETSPLRATLHRGTNRFEFELTGNAT